MFKLQYNEQIYKYTYYEEMCVMMKKWAIKEELLLR